MKTGIELISEERQDQIKKHGFDKIHDESNNLFELSDAAKYGLTLNLNDFPKNWDIKFAKKIFAKNQLNRLIVAGALIAAEIDRLTSSGLFKEEDL